MRSSSLASAKACLSKLVDDAQHRGRGTLILRHGKPAAALVPCALALGEAPSMSRVEIERLLRRFGRSKRSAVRDLETSRW